MTPEQARELLLVSVAEALLHLDAQGQPTPATDEIRRALAVVRAPRVFVCREHRQQFSSASPCGGCAAANVVIGFHVDVKKTAHVVVGTGKTACGTAVAVMERAVSTSALCPECYRAVPASIWGEVFGEEGGGP